MLSNFCSVFIYSRIFVYFIFDPGTFGSFTCCVSKKMRQPQKVYIDSVFIIHRNMSKCFATWFIACFTNRQMIFIVCFINTVE